MTLGLDLQGGAHVLMEIDSASLQKTMVEGLRDDVRGKMRDAHISISGGIAAQAKGVIVRIADAAERAKALDALQPLNTAIGSSISGAIGHTLDISDNGSGAIQLTFTDAAIIDKAAPGDRAIDRSAQPPHQRHRHQRDQRPAGRRRPHRH